MTANLTADELTAVRLHEARAAHERGWLLVPLNGKIPMQAGWQTAPAPTLQQVEAWAAEGNVGVRTGRGSGVIVVDVQAGAGALPAMPPCPTVETGGGGLHLYAIAPDPCPGCSTSVLAARVDVIGEGGQAVLPGSIHPVTQEPYRWASGAGPDDVAFPALPAEYIATLTGRPVPVADGGRRDKRKRESTHARMQDAGAERALLGAILIRPASIDVLRTTAHCFAHSKHQRIARSIVACVDQRGTVDLVLLRHELERAGELAAIGGPAYLAELCSAPDRAANAEAYAEIVRSMHWRRKQAAGAGKLRDAIAGGAADSDVAHLAAALAAAPEQAAGLERLKPDVLIPGGHVDHQDVPHEIGTDDFAGAVLGALPPGSIYRRSRIPGSLDGPAGRRQFREMTATRCRLLADAHVRCVRWARQRTGQMDLDYVASNRDMGSLVLEHAGAVDGSDSVRDLDLLVNYPVFLGPDLRPAAPGWNAEQRVYYDAPPELDGLALEPDPERCRAVIEDLVVDFPFREEADRDNFVGLLLTPLLRHGLGGNVPLHLIVATLERTGKSKLAEQVLGGVILGRPTPSMQLSGSDEERDKRIITALRRGDTLLHVDNVREYLDSAALSSLLTSRVYSSRLLGTNTTLELPNHATLVATGNNVRASSELVKRTVPIRLQPATDEPEARRDFRHPDLPAYVQRQRRAVLAALTGMIEAWRAAGQPLAAVPLGGFEEWARVIGGILTVSGWTAWLANLRTWRRASDTHGEDLRALVEAWDERYGTAEVAVEALLKIAEEAALFGAQLARAASDRARVALFGRVLARHVDAPVAGHVIRSSRSCAGRLYRLVSPPETST